MPYELIDISVAEKRDHPRLAGRVVGKVRVLLRETLDGHDMTHELFIPVWAQFEQPQGEGDVDMALMLRAATIVGKLKATLSGSDKPG